MKNSSFFTLLAGILTLPLSSARKYGIRAETQPTSLSVCQQKTITVIANAIPTALLTPTLITFPSNEGSNQQDTTTLLASHQQAPQSKDAFGRLNSAILGGAPPASSTGNIDAIHILPTPQVSVEMSQFAAIDTETLTTPTITAQPQYCHHDNCFRELIRFSAVFSSFCQIFTAARIPRTEHVGAAPTNCPGLAARTSSACTCLASLMAIPSTPSVSLSLEPTTTIRSTRLLTSTVTVRPVITASEFGGSTSVTTATNLPSQSLDLESTNIESTATIQLPLNSTTSTPMLLVTQVLATGTGGGNAISIPTLTPKWTNSSYSTTAWATSTRPTLLPSGVFPSLNSTPTVANSTINTAVPSGEPTKEVLKWQSLPASEGIKNCHQSEACKETSDIFENCVNRIPNFENNALIAECLCNPSNAWITTTSQCLQCAQEFLPEQATSDSPPSNRFADFTGAMQVAYCNASSQPFSRDLNAFLRVGQNTTAIFQSPIYLWDMDLLEEAVPAMKTYNDTLFVPAVKEGDGWNTFPVSRRSKKVFDGCLTQSVCQRAAATFELCMTGEGVADTWSCFCEPTKMFSDAEKDPEMERLDLPFQTLAQECAECIAFGLPALGKEGANADFFGEIVGSAFQIAVCDKNSTEGKAAAKQNVVRFGGRTTQTFECPVLVFNFTLLDTGFPYVGKRDLLDGETRLVERLVAGLWC